MTQKHTPETFMDSDSLTVYAPNTRRIYASAWRAFVQWSEAKGRSYHLPASTADLLKYLHDLAAQGRSWSTIQTHKSAVVKANRRAGLPNPADNEPFREAMRGLGRNVGKRQSQVQALTESAAAAVNATASIPRIAPGGQLEKPEQAAKRAAADIAMIAVMRDGLLRSAEAAQLRWDDLELHEDGTGRILVRQSKTDQAGQGTVLFLSRSCVQALTTHRHLHHATDDHEPVFGLGAAQIRRRIRKATTAAGLHGNFGGHSPRIGMAVDLAQSGTGLPEIQQAGRWESPRMPAHYIRGITAGQGAVARYHSARNS